MGTHRCAIGVLALGCLAGAVLACTPRPGPEQPPGHASPAQATATRPPPRPPSAPVFPDGFGRVYSERFHLSIPLPDPDAWQVERQRSSFLVLDHAPTGSQLVVRTWREDENMNRDRCEKRARMRRDFPTREGAETISRRPIEVPPDFDTMVDVGLVLGRGPGWARGYVMAFGGWARRCFAYVYTTENTGPQAEHVVAERLAVMHGRSLGHIELRSDTDPLPRSR